MVYMYAMWSFLHQYGTSLLSGTHNIVPAHTRPWLADLLTFGEFRMSTVSVSMVGTIAVQHVFVIMRRGMHRSRQDWV